MNSEKEYALAITGLLAFSIVIAAWSNRYLKNEIETLKGQAISNNSAKYIYNPTNGNVEFVWITNTNK